MQRLQRQGRRMTRADRCPYGWRPSPREHADGRRPYMEEHPDEQRVIALIIRYYRNPTPLSLGEIAFRLNEQRILARGKRWYVSSVRRVLSRAGLL
jgi:hypothetical protein